MSLEFHEEAGGQILFVRATGKLTRDDYVNFVPETERLINLYGKIRVLFEMHDFHGWDMTGMWEDMKFDVNHFKDIERLAIIGEKSWEHGMAVFCRPFTTANIQYFDRSQTEAAIIWIHDGVPQFA